MTDLPATYAIDDVFPAVRDGLSVKGTLYALPFYAESSMTYLPYRPVQGRRAEHAPSIRPGSRSPALPAPSTNLTRNNTASARAVRRAMLKIMRVHFIKLLQKLK